jgi:hypothetical protein
MYWTNIKNKYNHLRNLRILRKSKDNHTHPLKSFDDLECIFIHIPKCAGVSINKSLFGNLGGGHLTLKDYRFIFGKKKFDGYFKFTIVRNPWDRVVSAFHFLKKGGMNYADKEWADNNLSNYKDFDTFIKKWLNKENIFKYHHFRPQYHYICLKKNKIGVDFVGYIENINSDFEYISNKINIGTKLRQTNQSPRENYVKYYSEETKDIVANVYKDDIKLLGYDFDNSSNSNQINVRDNNILI